MKQILFSRQFPATHPKKGESTYFPEMIIKSLGLHQEYISEQPHNWLNDFSMHFDKPKSHTIRAGIRWKVGEFFAPKVWSDKPYRSKTIQFAPPIEIKKIWNLQVIFNSTKDFNFYLDGRMITSPYDVQTIAQNDGLSVKDFLDWFGVKEGAKPFHFAGQILCWNENIEYQF